MINTVTVHLPDDLYHRAEEHAVGRGASVETLVQEVVKDYLEHLDAPPPRVEAALQEAQPDPERALLMERLGAIRARIEASGEKLLSWEEIEEEMAQRRGGVREDE